MLVAIAGLLLCAGFGLAESARSHRFAIRPEVIAAPDRILWGAWVGNAFGTVAAPWDMATLKRLSQTTGKTPSIVHFYQNFEDCWSGCKFTPFPTRYLQSIRRIGAIPMLSWASMASSPWEDAQHLSLANIAHGKLDGYLRAFAREARRWHHPFFLRFDWEMNGTDGSFPWQTTVPGNSPGLYVAAYRHIHNLFRSVGADNATWVWCPLATHSVSASALRRIYPGGAYVDWTCLDGYNWGTERDWGGWMSFASIYHHSYHDLLKVAPAKPVMIGEFGSTEHGGSKAAWLRNALSVIPRSFKAIRAILYFDNWSDGMDWPLNSSAAAQAAFRTAIKAPAYATNSFSRLPGAGPIVPAP